MNPNNKTKKAKRKIKDCVFTNLFGDKNYLIKLYKALHPEDKSITQGDIDIVTLENILVDDIYNDLGFVVRDRLICLIEAQSTWTMNILLRVFLYYAKSLVEYIDENGINIYSSKKAEIPRPEFYVIFTGDRNSKPESIRLSEEFFKNVDVGIEITVKMLYGDGDDIIGEYVRFTKVFDEQRKLHGYTEIAIKETIKICKDRNILKEYLESREKEVIDMMITLYDEDEINRMCEKTAIERGIAQGKKLGIKQGMKQGKKLGIIESVLEFVKDGIITIEEAVERTGIPEEELRKYM